MNRVQHPRAQDPGNAIAHPVPAGVRTAAGELHSGDVVFAFPGSGVERHRSGVHNVCCGGAIQKARGPEASAMLPPVVAPWLANCSASNSASSTVRPADGARGQDRPPVSSLSTSYRRDCNSDQGAQAGQQARRSPSHFVLASVSAPAGPARSTLQTARPALPPGAVHAKRRRNTPSDLVPCRTVLRIFRCAVAQRFVRPTRRLSARPASLR